MSANYIVKSLQFVWQCSRIWTIVLVFTQLLQALLPIATLYLTKLLIDAITVADATTGFRSCFVYVLYIGGVQLLQSFTSNLQMLVSETQKQLVADHMSSVIIDKAIVLDMEYYENSAYHNTFHNAQKQALYRPTQLLSSMTDFLKSVFLLISIAGLMVFVHWATAVILILFALPIAGVQWYYAKKVYKWQKDRTVLEREANYLNRVLTSDRYAKEVRIFSLGEKLKENFISIRKRLFGEKYKIFLGKAKSSFFAKSLEIVATVLTYGLIVSRAVSGAITIGDLVMYFQAFQKGQTAIKSSLQSAVKVYDNRLFLSYIFDFLEIESNLPQSQSPKVLSSKIEKVDFSEVSFRYPDTDRNVINSFNLNLNKGEVVAIVGENGSGKTSFIKLITRLYDATGGSILVNGNNIDRFDIKELRKRMTVIFQDFARYQLDVSSNICMADDDIVGTEAKMRQAASDADAIDFILKLEDGFNQRLGRQFSKGNELSTGQWQKIALARAFFKDADIIILDEPSSSIDPIAEAHIFNKLKEISKDKILILISHRLYNLKIADRIVVMDEGHLVEQGTHTTLMNKGGLYKKMYDSQNVGAQLN